jgi:hypothetical protein
VTVLPVHHGIFEEISKSIGKLGGEDIDAALGKVLADRFQQKTGFVVLNSPYRQKNMMAVEKMCQSNGKTVAAGLPAVGPVPTAPERGDHQHQTLKSRNLVSWFSTEFSTYR